jgi:hypothetical protein
MQSPLERLLWPPSTDVQRPKRKSLALTRQLFRFYLQHMYIASATITQRSVQSNRRTDAAVLFYLCHTV